MHKTPIESNQCASHTPIHKTILTEIPVKCQFSTQANWTTCIGNDARKYEIFIIYTRYFGLSYVRHITTQLTILLRCLVVASFDVIVFRAGNGIQLCRQVSNWAIMTGWLFLAGSDAIPNNLTQFCIRSK